MNIVFMGTPDFAEVCLKKIAKKHNILAVYTQPDKPVGRKQVITPPAVNVAANDLGIPVFQPEKIKNNDEVVSHLSQLKPDVMVVVAYGKILPKDILEIPKYGCINVHGSLLPKYRGAAPIQWSVINGDEYAGVTTMFMNEGLDSGDMLLKAQTKIGDTETAGELFDRLAIMGADLLDTTLDELEKGILVPKKQNEDEVTYAPLLDKSICLVDFSQNAKQVCAKINGLSPWPTAVCSINGEKIKLYRAQVVDFCCPQSGVLLDNKKMIISCGDKAVRILEVQLVGSKRMADEDFLRGHKFEIGTSFNN